MEAKLLTELLACEIKGTLPDASYSALSEEELFELYKISVKHDIAHLAADALKRANALPSGKPQEAFMQQYTTVLFRCEGFLHTIDEIKTAFCRHNIPFVMLKGSAIRKYYPEEWMRTSCDVDVLVKPEDVERASEVFISELSYEKTDADVHDIAFTSDGNVRIELHFHTIEDDVFGKANKIMLKIWDFAHKIGETSEYELSDEMIYFYQIVHTAKHFHIGGCGIRPIIDIWVLQRSENFDENAGRELLKTAGLGKFEEALTKLSKIWFDGEAYTDDLKKVGDYILNGGAYGTSDNVIKLRTIRKGRFRYILGRIFAPYEVIAKRYPIVGKHKWLTPLFAVIRPFGLIFEGRLKHGAKELSSAINVNGKSAKEYTDVFDTVGLDGKNL